MAYGDGDRGVGGWLAFFLVTLGIISPLFLLVSGVATLGDPQLQRAYGEAWSSLLTGEIVLMAVTVIALWFACWRLLKVRNWASVRITIVVLWLVPLLISVGESMLVSSATGMSVGLIMSFMGAELVRPFVYAGIWTAYLLLSKRVRSTYAGAGSGTEEEMTEVFQ